MSEEPVEEITHPGPILRAARDELKMSVEQVADSLHLRPSVVLLIESGNYEDFSGDVFLKGYFRSYCRIVGLHEERMVALLEGQLARLKQEKQSVDKEMSDAKIKQKRLQLFKLLSVVAVVGGLGLAAIWLLAGDQSDSERAVVQRLESPQSDTVTGNAIGQGTMSEEPMSEGAMSEQSMSEDAEGSDPEVLEVEPKLAASEITKNSELELGSAENKAADSPNDAPLNIGALLISFSDECWIEVYDAEDRRLVSGLKKAGSSYVYQGAMPVRVVLGNGRVAEAMLNEQAFDLAPFVKKSGRAEIVFN
jgi:cytoskeletal protein RodZ